MLNCAQCDHQITENGDDAGLCTHCGGRNIRVVSIDKTMQWIIILGAMIVSIVLGIVL